jgi:hypothetical protein
MSYDDVYFDGQLDPMYEDFCEETQKIVKLDSMECEVSEMLRNEEKYEEEIDDYYIRLMRGEIQRIL